MVSILYTIFTTLIHRTLSSLGSMRIKAGYCIEYPKALANIIGEVAYL